MAISIPLVDIDLFNINTVLKVPKIATIKERSFCNV